MRNGLEVGDDTTLRVRADLDDDMDDGEQLREECWATAQHGGITEEGFEQALFITKESRAVSATLSSP